MEALSWWVYRKSQGFIKVSGIHPLGIIQLCARVYSIHPITLDQNSGSIDQQSVITNLLFSVDQKICFLYNYLSRNEFRF